MNLTACDMVCNYATRVVSPILLAALSLVGGHSSPAFFAPGRNGCAFANARISHPSGTSRSGSHPASPRPGHRSFLLLANRGNGSVNGPPRSAKCATRRASVVRRRGGRHRSALSGAASHDDDLCAADGSADEAHRHGLDAQRGSDAEAAGVPGLHPKVRRPSPKAPCRGRDAGVLHGLAPSGPSVGGHAHEEGAYHSGARRCPLKESSLSPPSRPPPPCRMTWRTTIGIRRARAIAPAVGRG